MEHGAWSMEHGAGGGELGAGSREKGKRFDNVCNRVIMWNFGLLTSGFYLI